MGGQIYVKNMESDDENEEDYIENEEDYVEPFGCGYGSLEELKGVFIRSAIGYLEALSAKNLSKTILIEEGILDAHAADEDEVVIITNYRLRIDTALKLLRSWCREQIGDGRSNLFQSLDLEELIARRNRRFEMPIDDSMLGPGMTQEMMGFLEDMNTNYRMDRIPKALPPVLRELNLQILHHYLAHNNEFNYEEAQQFVLFLDKTKPFMKFRGYWEREPPVEEIRAVFAGCKPVGKVLIG